MRISEIIPYMDLDRMSAKTFIEILNRLDRETPVRAETEDMAKARQYGDELHTLSVQQARLDARKTVAEINRLTAQAARDRSEAASVKQPVSGVIRPSRGRTPNRR